MLIKIQPYSIIISEKEVSSFSDIAAVGWQRFVHENVSGADPILARVRQGVFELK